MVRLRKQSVKIATLCGFLWLTCNMDAFFTWFFNANYVTLFSAFVIYLSTFFLTIDGETKFEKKNTFLLLTVGLLLMFLVIVKRRFINILTFSSLMCFICWSDEVLINVYCTFKKFIVFYAVASIFMLILIVSGFINYLPYFVAGAQDNVQELHYTENRIFFIFPTQYGFLGYSTRACGPLREGGHFALFLGFVYFIEKGIKNKRNIWILLCGILTFSSIFVIMFFISEFYAAYLSKKLFYTVLVIVGIVGTIIFVYMFLPDKIQDEIAYLIYGRNLESVFYEINTEGLESALDTRTNYAGRSIYDDFMSDSIRTHLIGFDSINSYGDGFVLSDYRNILCNWGIIGFILVILLILACSISYQKVLFLPLVLFCTLILIHRSWMFYSTYIYALMIMAGCYNKNHTSIAIYEK